MKSFIVFAALLALTKAQTILPGQCLDVQVVKNYNVSAYAGLWNEIYSYPNEFQPNGKCTYARYTPNVTATGIVDVVNSMIVNKFRVSISGTAKPAEGANGDAKLVVNFPLSDNVYSDYWVLSTDYKNYSLVYACWNITPTTRRVSSWILSREKTLSDESRKAVDAAIKVAQLDWNIYKQTDQTEEGCKQWN